MKCNKMEGKSQFIENLHDLRLATIQGNLEGVKTALGKGITVNQPLKGGWTALMYACSMGNPTIVEYLLQQGANPNFHKELFTPLMATCASTQKDESRLVTCVDLLLQYRANVNSTERHYISALMFAAKEGHNGVVTRLLAENCDVDTQDSQGWTALFWAVNQGKERVVQTLVQHGARTNIHDRCGQTVVDLARCKGLKEIAATLTTEPSSLFETHPKLISHSELSAWESSDNKPNYPLCKDDIKTMENLLDQLSTPINNNGRCRENFTKYLNNMDLETNLDVLKVQRLILSKLSHNVNGQFPNSMLLTNKLSKSVVVKENKSIAMSWKNIPYSAVEAREVLNQVVKQLEGLYTSMSYVRLHMQGNPPAALVEDKYARTSEVSALAEKALQRTQVLYNEIRFFHQFTQELAESDMVPADLVLQQKTDEHSNNVISTCIVAATVILILFHSRVLTFSFFSK